MNLQSVFRTGVIAVIALILVVGFVYAEVIDNDPDGVSDMYVTLTIAAMAAVGIGMAAPAAISAVQGQSTPSPVQQRQHVENVDRFSMLTEEVASLRDLLEEQRDALRREEANKPFPMKIHNSSPEDPFRDTVGVTGSVEHLPRRNGDNR
ncbi:MAG: hypothetical protein ACSLE3_15685 [Microbacteriaceae bacterium]